MISVPNLGKILDHVTERYPDAPALIPSEGEEISWRALLAWSDAIQAWLSNATIAPGDAVILVADNSPTFVAVFWAIIRSGAVVCPVNAKSKGPEIAHFVRVTKAKLILHDGRLTAADQDAIARESDAVDIVTMDAVSQSAVQSLSATPGGPQTACVDRAYDDPAWFFFTSGTTGLPKAAVLTHGQLTYVVTNHMAEIIPDCRPGSLSLAIAPLSHGAGLHMIVNAARGVGTVLTPKGSFDPARALDLMIQHEVSNFFAVPTIVASLVAELEQSPRAFAHLKSVVYAGAPMYREDQKRALAAFGPVLTQYYGLAEVTGNITVLPSYEHTQSDDMRVGSCGFARMGMEIRVVDPVTAAPVARHERGEICVRGPGVFAGYLNNIEATNAVLKDGWFHTGDLGYLDEASYLYLTGRKSDMFISGGANVYPREIEEAALQHGDVEEASVIGVPHAKWGEAGVMVISSRRAAVDATEINAFLRERLTSYKIPKLVLQWDDIPKTSYGKVSKKMLREILSKDDQFLAAWEKVN